MPPLYPRMRERPMEFRINYDAPLAEGLVFAGLGGHGCVGSMVYPDSSLYANHGTLTNMDAATDWVWDEELGRWVLDFQAGAEYVNLPVEILAGLSAWSMSVWAIPLSNAQGYILNAPHASGNTLLQQRKSKFQAYVGGYATAEIAFQYGPWVNHVITFSGSRFDYYIAGVWQEGRSATWPGASAFGLGNRVLSQDRGWIGRICDAAVFNRILTPSEISALADPSNVDLRVGGVPLILPPRRRLFTTAVAAGPTFNPAWAAHCNTYIGLGSK